LLASEGVRPLNFPYDRDSTCCREGGFAMLTRRKKCNGW